MLINEFHDDMLVCYGEGNSFFNITKHGYDMYLLDDILSKF